jgi:hypothetical protein
MASISSSDDDQRVTQRKRKARRVSTNAAAAPAANHEESIQSIGKMIQDLFHSDDAKVGATLKALHLNLNGNVKQCDKLHAVGGCFALVQLMKNCLDKAIDEIPACDQVTGLNDIAELTTLRKTLIVIIRLTHEHVASRIGITAIGGVEAVFKVMKTFPKCRTLQLVACGALRNLASRSLGKANTIESGGIEAVLAVVSNHLGSAILCENACVSLYMVVKGSKENIGLLITLGGGSALAKVRTKWPDNNYVQTEVRKVANLMEAEMKAW